MRLTVDLIQSSLSFLNPLKERELDLRGHKISVIENLAVAGQQDAIDFTDNDITSLSNFPLSPRLRTLMLSRNRVSHISSNLADLTPNLTTLVLTANNVMELADLDPLRRLPRLTHLSLLENPVTRKENYRLWIIWRFASVRFLDYQKVKDAERTAAEEMFGTSDKPTAAASKVLGIKSSKTVDAGTALSNLSNSRSDGGASTLRVKLTDQERAHVQDLIKNAKSLQEIARLEKALAEGRIPGGMRG